MLPPQQYGYLWIAYVKLDSILGEASGSRPRMTSRGYWRPAEAEFFFGSNDSFWPQRQSLMVPDGVRPPQNPPAASRPSKAGRGRIFFLDSNDSFWPQHWSLVVPDGVWPPRTLQRPWGHQRPAEAEIFFGSNGSFWPQHWSLVVPDGLWPPQDPPAASRPSKVGQDQFFFGAGTILHMKSTMSPWSRSEQRRRAKRAVVASS